MGQFEIVRKGIWTRMEQKKIEQKVQYLFYFSKTFL